MIFPLPPTATDHPPVFLTELACHDWLASVPLANSAEAQVMLLRQTNLLNNYTLPPATRLALLEILRGTVSDVQDDMAKKFACKPLPLTPPEQAALDGTLALWNALLNGYLRLLNVAEEDASLAPERARIGQRALVIFSDWQVDLCRGARLPNGTYWQTLNTIFSAVENMGVENEAVDDALRNGSTQTSPLAAYCEAILLYTASPIELVPRQLNWVARWSRRWSSKLNLLQAPPTVVGNRALPIFVDLASNRPPCYFPKDAVAGRWLETSALRKSLKIRLAMLEKGEQPSKLNMGEDCTQPAAGLLLQRVYHRWCKGGSPRRQERKSASGNCEFIIGLEAVHYYLSGSVPFRPPLVDDKLLREEREAMATFGDRARIKSENYSAQHGFDLENWSLTDDWQLLDASSSGLRLARPLKEGVRVGSGNLVAVKLAGSSNFILGAVRWALQSPANESGTASMAMLSAGVELYPGIAHPVAVRGADPGARENYRQGMKLPAVPTLSIPESLVLPNGTYRVGRPVEVHADGHTTKVYLERVLDRTTEFERCTFKPG